MNGRNQIGVGCEATHYLVDINGNLFFYNAKYWAGVGRQAAHYPADNYISLNPDHAVKQVPIHHQKQ